MDRDVVNIFYYSQTSLASVQMPLFNFEIKIYHIWFKFGLSGSLPSRDQYYKMSFVLTDVNVKYWKNLVPDQKKFATWKILTRASENHATKSIIRKWIASPLSSILRGVTGQARSILNQIKNIFFKQWLIDEIGSTSHHVWTSLSFSINV